MEHVMGNENEGSSAAGSGKENTQEQHIPFTVGDAERLLRTARDIFRSEREAEDKRVRTRSRRKWIWILGIILALILSSIIFGDNSEKMPIDQALYQTLPVLGGGKAKAHVAIIPISGEIDGDIMGPPQFSNTTRYIAEALALAKEEKNLVAVIFYINSPGGSAVASEQGYRLIKEFREKEKHVHVFAYVSQGAYSGGYYLALGADKIIIDPAAEAANIGVISHNINTYEIGRMFGVKEITIKSGLHKDAGSQWKKDNDADRAMMQRSNDLMFHRFLLAVSESRHFALPHVEREAKKQRGITSGAWFGAEDAKANGLVDEIMTIEELTGAISMMLVETKKYGSVEFIRYDKKLPIMKEWEKGVASGTEHLAAVFMRGMLKEMERHEHTLRAE